MDHFLSIDDVDDPMGLAKMALKLKAENKLETTGAGKVMGLIFLNPSLRTRMSTAKAAFNLGLEVITLNVGMDSWILETEDGVVMNGASAEHIKDAAAVMGQYCDLIGIRSFPGLKDRESDYSEKVITAFSEHAGVPIVNLESCTLHPRQSLADLATIEENKTTEQPKVVLTWAPHIKPLPQSVANSFAQWMKQVPVNFVITHPEGLELAPEFAGEAKVVYDQNEALANADFVYVKNWSGFSEYGRVYDAPDWQVTLEKLSHTNQAKLMHCMPIRRNLVISDDAMDSNHSVISEQAGNRVWSAQAVLKTILQS